MKSILVACLLGQLAAASPAALPVRIETRAALNSRLANVHLSFKGAAAPTEALSFTYGNCNARRADDAHHVIARTESSKLGERLVWLIPDDARTGGCISAWDDAGILVGRSEAQHVHEARDRHSRRRRALSRRAAGANSVSMTNSSGIDAHGPWFDGVELLQSKNLSSVDVAAAKEKRIGIVGGGMSGLMTYLVLSQAGMTNIEILEASERLGGRVHTAYLSGGPFDYSYQEMGPMRFPKSVSIKNETHDINDHKLVFDLADEMNRLNGHDANISVDFIPWYQSSPNGLTYQNGFKLPETGLPPTVGQIAANSSLGGVSLPQDESTRALSATLDSVLENEDFLIKIATNMFQAHKEFVESGLGGLPGEHWSEFAYLVNYLKANLNDTSIVAGGPGEDSFWHTLYGGVYFDASEWSTIDGGLSRLPESFHPLVDDVTKMGVRVERVQQDKENGQVTLQWRDSALESEFQSATYDYAVVAAPFSVVRSWRFSSKLPTTINNAINQMPYGYACKVALEFSERFWEKLANPIYGSCSTSTDIPGVGSVCYPSYNINGTGPASIMASYISSGEWGLRWASVPEEEHVQYILDAILEIHGEAAEGLYTGNYSRVCWVLDELESGAWASPTVGQHELFIPEYFKTHDNIIFVGEHTSYTHAWIASALESGVRGSVQLLLELGLVDEAKAAVDKWMARWIEV